MLKTRIIPTLLYRDFGLVKGVSFDSRRAIGSPLQAIKVYEMRGVDELVFLDVRASIEGRGPDLALIDDLADECFMPLTVGGGVRTVEDVRDLLRVGADKVAINTAALEHPEIVAAAAEQFGSQCVVVSIDTRRRSDGTVTVWSRAATVDTGRDPVDLACTAERAGAGEILLTSADADGTLAGYDVTTIAAVAEAVSIPVVASGGAGSFDDFVAALGAGASAVAAAAMFHFTEQTPREAREHIRAAGYPVRT
ncbi:MAG: imidazole glycerol phosphate synthase subunit HisF [Acidimicrobiia bacterium]